MKKSLISYSFLVSLFFLSFCSYGGKHSNFKDGLIKNNPNNIGMFGSPMNFNGYLNKEFHLSNYFSSVNLFSGEGLNCEDEEQVKAVPTVSFELVSDRICLGEALVVKSVTDGADSYTWKLTINGTVVNTYSGKNPTIVPTARGGYVLVLDTKFGNVAGNSVRKSVEAGNKPNSTFSIVPGICGEISMVLNDPSTVFTMSKINFNDVGAIGWGGGLRFTNGKINNRYAANGNYLVSLEMYDLGCFSRFEQRIDITNLRDMSVEGTGSICVGKSNLSKVKFNPPLPNNDHLTFQWNWHAEHVWVRDRTSTLTPIGFASEQLIDKKGFYRIEVKSDAPELTCISDKTRILIFGIIESVNPVIKSHKQIIAPTCGKSNGTAELTIDVNEAQRPSEYYYIVNGVNKNYLGTYYNYPGLTEGNNVLNIVSVTNPSCASTYNLFVPQRSLMFNAAVATTSSSCSGSDGTCKVTVTNAVQVSYKLTNIGSGVVLSNTTGYFEKLSAGNHTLEIKYKLGDKDAEFCTTTREVKIAGSGMSVLLDQSKVLLCDGLNPNLLVTAKAVNESDSRAISGVTYSWHWKNASGSWEKVFDGNPFSPVSLGEYKVIGKDGNCTSEAFLQVGSKDLSFSTQIKKASCKGNDGSLKVTIANAFGSFFKLTKVNTSTVYTNANGIFEGLVPGDYLLEVSYKSVASSKGTCVSTSTITIGDTRLIGIDLNTKNFILCDRVNTQTAVIPTAQFSPLLDLNPAVSYQWFKKESNGTWSLIGSDATYTPSQVGEFKVIGTLDKCSAEGLFMVGSQSSTRIVTTKSGCSDVTFDLNPSIPGPGRWSFGDGITSPTARPTHTYLTNGIYTCSYVAEGSNCPIFTTVKIESHPNADFSYSISEPCNPAAGIKVKILNYNTSVYSYYWIINDQTVAATAAESVLTTNLINGVNTIKLKVIDRTGCAGQQSKQISIGIAPIVFEVKAAVCKGSMVSFTSVTNGASEYNWTLNGPMGTQNFAGQYPQIPLPVVGTYNLTLKAKTGNCLSAELTKTITVSSMPNAEFTVSSESTCGKISVSLSGTAAFSSYKLSFGDEEGQTPVVAGASIPDLEHTYSTNGVYTIQLDLFDGGCTATFSRSVTINSFRKLSIAGDLTKCKNVDSKLKAVVMPSLDQDVNLLCKWYEGSMSGNVIGQTVTQVISTANTYFLEIPVATALANCISSKERIKSVIVKEMVTPLITSHVLKTIPNCTGNNGVATLSLNLGTGVSSVTSYRVNSGPVTNASTGLTYEYSNLQEGDNFLTISNAENSSCASNYKITVAPGNIEYTIVKTSSTCAGANGAIKVNVTRGSVVKYTLSGVGNSIQISNTNGNFTNLNAGAYNLKLEYTTGSGTNLSNCALNAPLTLDGTVLTVGLVNSDVRLCASGNSTTVVSATGNLSSGTGSIVYTWFKGNANGTWGSLSSGTTLTVNSLGFYKVVGQVGLCSSEFTFEVKPAEPIQVKLTANEQKCFSDKITINSSIFGGVGTYTHTWSNSSATGSSLELLNFTAQNQLITLSVKDQMGCAGSGSITVSGIANPLTICQPTGKLVTENYYHIDGCKFTDCASGGTGPYNFSWYFKAKIKERKVLQFTYDVLSNKIINSAKNAVNVPPVSMVPQNVINEYNSLLIKRPIAFTIPYSTQYEYTHWMYNGALATKVTPFLKRDGITFIPVDVVTEDEVEVERIQNSNTGATNTGNFVTGNYRLEVTDSKGCKVSIDKIYIDVPVTSSFVTFEFVWEDDSKVKEEEPPVEDKELIENIAEAVQNLTNATQNCLAEQMKQQKELFSQNCLDLMKFNDQFSLKYSEEIDQYTLYYYDRAGQLVKTVSPEGVEMLTEAEILNLKNYRDKGIVPSTRKVPEHRLATTYRYNSLGQLIYQYSPDGGGVTFIYDANNRLRFSQNDYQKANGLYSYTRYDKLGRAIEAGESSNFKTAKSNLQIDIAQIEAGTANVLKANLELANDNNFPENSGILAGIPFKDKNKYVTISTYSQPFFGDATYYGQEQRFLINRISRILKDGDGDLLTKKDQFVTYYSYDPHGNVEWLIQENAGLGQNTVRYEYDLISGKVLQVYYNENKADKFMHKYNYDAENRLEKVQTSRDGNVWDEDARYYYYKHGALKRTVLGEDHVQGLDYLYTAQGWLKSINTPNLQSAIDPGKDGKVLTTDPVDAWNTTFTANDIFGMSLGYFQGDYVRTAGSFNDQYKGLYTAPGANDLFNGNISHWSTSRVQQTAGVIGKTEKVSSFVYRYDILNRLAAASSFEANVQATNTTNAALTFQKGATTAAGVLKANAFDEKYTYDRNGNIATLKRNDDNGLILDDMAYSYDLVMSNTNPPAALVPNKKQTNRLRLLSEKGNKTSAYGDIAGDHKYEYDQRGNLTKETGSERLMFGTATANYDVETSIDWTPTGKVGEIKKIVKNSTGTVVRVELISFAYDAMDMRVQKTFKFRENNGNAIGVNLQSSYPAENTTVSYYVHDASGNPMAVYEKKATKIENKKYAVTLKMVEQSIYGSSRIGQNTKEVEIAKLENIDLTDKFELPEFEALPTGLSSRSEYQNWITTTQDKTSTAAAPSLDGICQCKVKKLAYTTSASVAGNAAQSSYIENASVTEIANFLGVAENGVALAEDLNGVTQFYTVLVKNYNGVADACLVYDVNGNLMKGMDAIVGVDVESKPIIVNLPGTKRYILATRAATGKLIYHTIDMSLAGYGTVHPAGDVISANVALSDVNDLSSTQYGLHLTGFENHVNMSSILYGTRYKPSVTNPQKGKTEVVAYEFKAVGSAAQVNESILYTTDEECGNTNKGEIQISPKGDKLVWWQYGKNISGFAMRTAEIYILPLGADRISLGGEVTHKPISGAGSYGRGVVEFMKDDQTVLYSQRGIYDPTNKQPSAVWSYDPVNGQTMTKISPESLYLFSEIKRGVDGKYYMPNMGKAITTMHTFDGVSAQSVDKPVVYSAPQLESLFDHTSALPTQVFKLYRTASVAPSYIFTRTVGQKVYELNDHLGNVRVVISDVKMLADNDNSNTVSAGDVFYTNTVAFTDYYPFGMQMPNRKGQASKGYRYGFQGQEKDNEVKGEGNSDNYKYRMHDPRIGRFFAVDPLTTKYPWYTPYQFSGNKVIHMVELEGLEEKEPLMHQRHVFQKMDFFKSNATKNSMLLNKISDDELKVLYKEASQLAKDLEMKEAYIPLSNNQVWYINTTTGKFYPVKGESVINLTKSEVSLWNTLVKQVKDKKISRYEAIQNMAKSMEIRGIALSPDMEKAINKYSEMKSLDLDKILSSFSNDLKEVPQNMVPMIMDSQAENLFPEENGKFIEWGKKIYYIHQVAKGIYDFMDSLEIEQALKKSQETKELLEGGSMSGGGSGGSW